MTRVVFMGTPDFSVPVLETIIKSLVEFPEQVNVTEASAEKSIIFEVKVADTDMGKVIGKQGKIAKSIRTLMKSIAGKEHKRITIEFID